MSAERPNLRWWRQSEPHSAVVETASRIRNRQQERVAALLTAYCLYDDYPATDFSPGGYRIRRADTSDQTLCFNVVRSCADTVRSEIIESRPRPMFLTQGGDYSARKRGKQMGKFIEGVFSETRFDRLASLVCLDAIVCGAGIVRPYERDGRIRLDRILPHELWVDARDAYYGEPRSAYLTRWLDRDVLLELYPDHEAAILASVASNDAGWSGEDGESDQVLVHEAWHLPSGKEAGDGRHVIVIDGATLLTEDFKDEEFPFVVLRWKDSQQGYWPKGLAEELTGLQRSLNRCSNDIEDGQELHAHTKIAVERSANISEKKFTADGGTFVPFDRMPPQAIVIPAVSGEVYQREETLLSRAYQLSGVAASAARSEKPAGLQSGVALRLHADLQSRRFLDFQRAFEAFYLDVVRQIVALMRRLSDEDSSYDVVYRGKHHVERIAWNDVCLEDGAYELQVWPVSLLPSTPAGKLETVQEMVNSGFADRLGMPPEAVARLLDFPDLEAALGVMASSWDLIEQTLEQLLDDGEDGYTPPEPFDNLALCLLVGTRHYQQWRLWKVPEDRLDLLRQWLSDCQALLAKANPPPAAQAAPPAAPPMPGAGLPLDPSGAPGAPLSDAPPMAA